MAAKKILTAEELLLMIEEGEFDVDSLTMDEELDDPGNYDNMLDSDDENENQVLHATKKPGHLSASPLDELDNLGLHPDERAVDISDQHDDPEELRADESSAEDDEKSRDPDYQPESDDSSEAEDIGENGQDDVAQPEKAHPPTQHDNSQATGPPIHQKEALQNEAPPKAKRRRRNPKKWNRNVRKELKDTGKEYISTANKVVPPVSMGQPCDCRSKRFEKLGESASAIFKSFWEIGNKELQDSCLFGGIKCMPVKRKRPRSGDRENSRGNSFQYSVKLLSGEHQNVCRKAFIAVYGIGKKRFERIQKEAGTGMTSPKDKRGKHHNHVVIEQNIKQQINDHIKSFPRRQSHYSRTDNPNRFYLHENLNMRRMWLMYLNRYEPEEFEKLRRKEKARPKVKYWLYCDIFTKDHNLSFGQPRTDTCNLCDRLSNEMKVAEQNGNLTKKDELKRQLEFHHRKAEKGYTLLKTMMKKVKAGELDLLTFDFQQNLPVPTLKNSDIFYARLLWTYNFGIHNGADDSGCMNIWAESEAKRGSSEVCSCLEHYLDTHPTKTDHLVLFSDGCGGQNKNKIMFCFLMRLVSKKKFKRIDHFFLTRGHTFLPNDRDFAVIEKYKRGDMAYVPTDYVEIIKNARTSNQFEVVQMESRAIKDYVKFSRANMKQTSLKDYQNGKNVTIRSIMWFSYGQSEVMDLEQGTVSLVDHPGEIWGRCTYNELESWMKFQPLKRGADIRYDNVVRICRTVVL